MKRRMLTSGLVMSVLTISGCNFGESEAKRVESQNPVCGLIYSSDSKFIFSCDEGKLRKIQPTLIGTNRISEQYCHIKFNEQGNPMKFNCTPRPKTIDDFIANNAKIEGIWRCNGVDDYGFNEHASFMRFQKDGSYQMIQQAKVNNEDIWNHKSTLITGEWSYGVNTNTLLIEPKSIKGELVDQLGLDLKNAPSYMRSAMEIEVSLLTKTTLMGKGARTGSRSYHKVKCGSAPDFDNLLTENDLSF